MCVCVCVCVCVAMERRERFYLCVVGGGELEAKSDHGTVRQVQAEAA